MILTVKEKTPPQAVCYKNLKKLKSICTMLLERNNLEGISKWYNVVIVFKLLNNDIMFRLNDNLSVIILDIWFGIYEEVA